MARRPTTVEIDEGIPEALGRAAREDARPGAEVVEEALRRYFGLRGLALLDDIAAAQAAAGVSLDHDGAMTLRWRSSERPGVTEPAGPLPKCSLGA